MPLPPEARQAYINKVKAQLDQYDAQLSEMRARADKVTANARVEYHSMMEEAIVKRDAIQTQLGELQSSSESAWEEIQEGLEKAGAELQKSFGAALDKFK